ncbi:MAG: site-specific integrase [Cyanobacteria bacterium J06554_1]
MPKVNREGKALVFSLEQLESVFTLLRYPHNAIANICYWTASRAGEIVALPTKAVTAEAVLIKQTKTKVTKEIDIYPKLAAALELVNPGQVYCFPGRKPDTHLTLRAFQKELDSACESLDIRGASSHSFRRSMATHLYLAQVDLESIRQTTGHKSLTSLTEYIDISRLQAQKKVAAALEKIWT